MPKRCRSNDVTSSDWQTQVINYKTNPRFDRPGVYPDVPFETYCEIKAVNSSSLGPLLEGSPHDFITQNLGATEDRPSLVLGSFIHAGKLEPHLLEELYVVIPEAELIEQAKAARAARIGSAKAAETKNWKATNEYKTAKNRFLAVHHGKQEVSMDWYTKQTRLLHNMAEDPVCVELFSHGYPELTLVWEQPIPNHPPILCKARIDWFSLWTDPQSRSLPRCIVDLKTSSDPAYSFHLSKWNYHRQQAFYHLGVRHLFGHKQAQHMSLPRIVLLETTSVSNGCYPYPIGATSLMQGYHEISLALAMIADCRRRKEWPRYVPRCTSSNMDAWPLDRPRLDLTSKPKWSLRDYKIPQTSTVPVPKPPANGD